MKLTIVIPAFNEEPAIASIIERSLAARRSIAHDSPVTDVEIIVVSDGSTDGTATIASGYADVRVIVFERNRGYGAAIKRGFEEGTGDLVGFLDADGTCDPGFFATLCRVLVEEDADVAIGSRLGPKSRMPRVRRLGNRFFALILSALSNRVVTDSASGMRVIRRDALKRLYPLPDGLHFTPAMSTRVLMDDQMTIVERPMAYEERVGESKLHVLRDGIRFLRTLFEMTLMWRPAKLFIGAAVLCLVATTLLAMHPLETWLRTGRLAESMIYRLLFCASLGVLGVGLLSGGVVSNQFRDLLEDRPRARTFVWSLLGRAYSLSGFAAVTVLAAPVLVGLVGKGAWTWLTEGYSGLPWSRIVPAGLLILAWSQWLIAILITHLIRFHAARRSIGSPHRATELVRAASKSRDIADRKGFASGVEDHPVGKLRPNPLERV